MYCTKCGKQLADDAVFCSTCGTKQQTETFNANIQEVDTGNNNTHAVTSSQAQMFTSIAASIACIVMLFLKWVDIPIIGYYGGESRLSIFSVFKYIDEIYNLMGSYAVDSSIRIVAIFLVATAIISMILYAVTIILIVNGSQKRRTTGAWAMALLLLEFAFLQFSTIVVNNEIGGYSYGYVNSVISMTGVAYIAVIISLIGFMALFQIPTIDKKVKLSSVFLLVYVVVKVGSTAIINGLTNMAVSGQVNYESVYGLIRFLAFAPIITLICISLIIFIKHKVVVDLLPIIYIVFAQTVFSIIATYYVSMFGDVVMAGYTVADQIMRVITYITAIIGFVFVLIVMAKNRTKEQTRILRSKVYATFAVAALIAALFPILFRVPLLRILNVPVDIFGIADRYLVVAPISFVFVYVYIAINLTFPVSENRKPRILVVSGLVSIVLFAPLSNVLTNVFGLGINGFGVAMVIAQFVNILINILNVAYTKKRLKIRSHI